jgi:hypothetical protein
MKITYYCNIMMCPFICTFRTNFTSVFSFCVLTLPGHYLTARFVYFPHYYPISLRPLDEVTQLKDLKSVCNAMNHDYHKLACLKFRERVEE